MQINCELNDILRRSLTILLGVTSLACLQLLWANPLPERPGPIALDRIQEDTARLNREALDIYSELLVLEEDRRYPPASRATVFLTQHQDAPIRLQSVNLYLDGKALTSHSYDGEDRIALNGGGAQRLWIGNVENGGHNLGVLLNGEVAGRPWQRSLNYRFGKRSLPKVLEINLADDPIARARNSAGPEPNADLFVPPRVTVSAWDVKP